MKYLFYSITIIVFGLNVSCKKEIDHSNLSDNVTEETNTQDCIIIDTLEGVQTILPSEYYPAYPGSYWEYYDTVNNSFETVSVDNDWKLYPIVISENVVDGCIVREIKMTYLPKITSGNYVKNNYFLPGGSKIIDTNIGAYYNQEYYPYVQGQGGGHISSRVVQFHSSINIMNVNYSDVYQIRNHRTLLTNFGDFEFNEDLFFAKDIGLVHSFSDLIMNSGPSYKILNSYHINN